MNVNKSNLKYVVIVVKDREDKKPTVEFDDLKIEYVAVGEQFVSRRFKMIRPTHVIDQTKIPEWYEYFTNHLSPNVRKEEI